MPIAPLKALLNWSGGKDAALALYRLQQGRRYTVTDLLTTCNGASGRVSMHGVRQELIQAQANRMSLRLHTLDLPETTSMAAYSEQMAAALRPLAAAGVSHVVFGDIFLEDLRQWRQQHLADLGLTAVFPLWQTDSMALLEAFWAAGFRAMVVAVNGQRLHRSCCGRLLDRQFVRELPTGVDPCGENGEFHTFVFEAPYFLAPIPIRRGETVERTYTFTDAAGQAQTALYYFIDLFLS